MGGTLDDVRYVCCQGGGVHDALSCLLLMQRLGCATQLGEYRFMCCNWHATRWQRFSADTTTRADDFASVVDPAVKEKIPLVLKQGLHADPQAAKRFVAAKYVDQLSLTALQHRVQLLFMYGVPVEQVPTVPFGRNLKTVLLPRLEYVAQHRCATQPCVLSQCAYLCGFGTCDLRRGPHTRFDLS